MSPHEPCLVINSELPEEITRLRLMSMPTPFLRLLYVLTKQVLDRRGEQ